MKKKKKEAPFTGFLKHNSKFRTNSTWKKDIPFLLGKEFLFYL